MTSLMLTGGGVGGGGGNRSLSISPFFTLSCLSTSANSSQSTAPLVKLLLASVHKAIRFNHNKGLNRNNHSKP